LKNPEKLNGKRGIVLYMKDSSKKIPVILDTDIGDDFDDMWALVMVLKCPELDIKLITASVNNTHLKARIVAKTLALAGREDIPIGIGIKRTDDPPPQSAWADDFDMANYDGVLDDDAPGAIVRTILESPEPITLIAIGPMTTVAQALKLNPAIAQRTNFVAMVGRFEHLRGAEAKPEYNAKCDIPATQKVFTAPWARMTITPTDSCAQVVLRGERYEKLASSDDPLVSEVIKAYRIWNENCSWFKCDPDVESSILFDTVAIYLVWTTEHLEMQNMPVVVRDNGVMDDDPAGMSVNVALDWKDLDAFKDFFVERMLSPLA